LAAKIETVLGVVSSLIPAGRGIFDVVAEGDLVYSKYKTGTFPDADELVDQLAGLQKTLD